MSKRRRASSVASRGADGDDSDDGVDHTPGPPPSARKKKKLDPVSQRGDMLFAARLFHKSYLFMSLTLIGRHLQVLWFFLF